MWFPWEKEQRVQRQSPSPSSGVLTWDSDLNRGQEVCITEQPWVNLQSCQSWIHCSCDSDLTNCQNLVQSLPGDKLLLWLVPEFSLLFFQCENPIHWGPLSQESIDQRERRECLLRISLFLQGYQWWHDKNVIMIIVLYPYPKSGSSC